MLISSGDVDDDDNDDALGVIVDRDASWNEASE